ncbi:MAG TPA: CerR family C-terminal domain-containing protein [Sphingomicrobium sp.]|nr:CerR family C-terminal domain-containing protein [Sphingomicrobium sp.]
MLSERLLDVAIDHFGQFGFDGASTRAIARNSGTAMSSITYHFGSKEQLYLEAARHIGRRMAELQSSALEEARTKLAGTREEGIEAVLVLIDSLARMMLQPASESWARFIMREQQAPTAAFDALYEGVMKDLSETLVALIRHIRPQQAEPSARAMAVLMVGQAMILRGGRAAVCRVLRVDTIDDATGELLRSRLRANVLCILSEKS